MNDDLDAAAAESLHDSDPAGLGQATTSMSCELLVPGPHITVTPRRTPTPADIARANNLRARLRQALGKYEDYRVAERDGFEIRFPNVQQKIYHFTNPANAAASYHEAFDPLRPTSILYEKTTAGYKLVGVMYTAPQRARAAGLDARFPISVAPWHLHTNICLPPPGTGGLSRHQATPQSYGRFGPRGSIATQEECTTAGGQFIPIKYGWMTHVDFYDSSKP
ncbi:MAG TPA: hypothetical protein VL086_01280 [Candidatus Nitrosotalea sp.]|nr:hypothetical protein [Candidatus Nitrosotalea sp.]